VQSEIGVPARRTFRVGRLLAGVLVVAAASAAVIGANAESVAREPRPPDGLPVAVVRAPAAAATVLSGPPSVIAADAARLLFASSPVVVIAGGQADLSAAASLARRLHAPMLLSGVASTPGSASRAAAGRAASGSAGPHGGGLGTGLRAVIRALHARAVLALGLDAGPLASQLPGVRVVAARSALPAALRKVRLGHPALRAVALLVHGQAASSAAALAAGATAEAAGARVIGVGGYDPRADPAAISALAAAPRPRYVLAIGSRFGPPTLLAARVAVAETGVQLPGGGQLLFNRRMIVALYGHPGAPSLGALGEQNLPASIARARQMAAPYRTLTGKHVVPGFEIIATVAEASPGPDGSYSYETPVAMLRPWVRRANAAGMYVILDLQAGRDSLLGQAKKYAPLLKLPDVGLALDPEWKLQPGQLPLRQIGTVSIGQVNQVVSWLAGLTARYRLPQKLLELHEFRLSMITDEQALDTRHDDLAIVINMDGQGTPGDKQQTWQAVTGAAPGGVYFGWKDFLVKDHPMLTPPETMSHEPIPVLISYE
jgi:hypothetical protein